MNLQLLNALNQEVSALRLLYDVTFELKKIRAKMEVLGVASLTDEDFPLDGSLSYVTRERIANVLSAMDELDAAFVTPNAAGVPPIKAIVDMVN